ncbi:hypothetical protein C4J98_3844 [Pseudomonas orientalis]|nr:hypothetical protein C4J98_3844 [Pseudomonas orientalis]
MIAKEDLRRSRMECDQSVGGGLPPIAVVQCRLYQLTDCYRGQAPSHI